MTAEVIEGEAREVEEPRALAVIRQQPGQAIVTATTDTGPTEMLSRATAIATALAKMVEAQKLYTVISGKKYPQVEAWMTIGRMDNVVAREAHPPVRQDDGAYEAVVELVRLSDGMVIGNGSALCGSKGDRPWDSRADHQKRSMSVTRATSRAFRQQYSWIMALAGYEPTPADEMPPSGPTEPPPALDAVGDGLIGVAEVGKPPSDFELRQTPEGHALSFRLRGDRGGIKVMAHDALAVAIAAIRSDVEGQRVTCWGHISDETFTPKGKTSPVTYQVLTLARMTGPTFAVPTTVTEAPSVPMFSAAEEEAIDAALAGVEIGA